MTNKIASFTADFSQTKQVKIETESSIQTGKPFKIKIWSPETYTIESFYGNVSSLANENTPRQTEIISLNAEPAYPVKNVVYKKTANPIVDTFQKSVAVNPFQSADDLDNENYVGSVKIIYDTFAAQVFEHSGIDLPGDCVIWAKDSNGCRQEIKFNVAQTDENDSYSIILEGHDRKLGTGICYTVRMFTSDAHKSPTEIKVSHGTFTEIASQQVLLKETLNFSNSTEASARVYMEAVAIPINTSQHMLVDENYDFVTPTFTLTNGKLVSSIKVSGQVVVEYLATARLFNHYPAINGNKKLWGTFLAANRNKKFFTTFDTFSAFVDRNTKDVIRVYRDQVINSQTNSPFELPSDWPDNNNYTGLSPLESDKPEVGVGAVSQKLMDTVFVENSYHQYGTPANDWVTPSAGNLWENAVIHIKKDYPSTPDDDFDQPLIDMLDAEFDYLVTQYEAVFATVIQE